MAVGYSEDLVGEALQVLYEKHGYKREDLFVQTKRVINFVDLADDTINYMR
jgi:diketogulonate reductase-like aldo/keto reductase